MSVQQLSSFSTTFQVFNITPEIVSQNGFPSAEARICENEHVISQLKQYEKNNCSRVLSGTKFSRRTRASNKNGFVSTVLKSYAYHHNLVIRPEDIWIAIMTQFSLYINANSEEFRKKFVNFEGKKELEVTVPGSVYSASYENLISSMTEKIHENLVDSEIKSWILPNFSTTTKDDLVTTGAIFMATLKNYFDYTFSMLCGIPKITLEGTVSDYEDIFNRLEKLKFYKLEKWVNMLQPILQQFVEAKRGNVDLEFWQRIVYLDGGCGGPSDGHGWITVFAAFNKHGKWQGDIRRDFVKRWESDTQRDVDDYLLGKWPSVSLFSIPSGVVEVDVKINDHGTEYESVLFAGHMAYEVLDDNVSLRPRSGWAIALKNFKHDDGMFECKVFKNEVQEFERGRYGCIANSLFDPNVDRKYTEKKVPSNRRMKFI